MFFRRDGVLKWRGFVFVVFVMLISNGVESKGFTGDDFTLRFPAALNRVSTYPDVAGFGGASAGSPWSSSINPASMVWTDVKSHYKIVTSPIYTDISFDEGTNFHIGVMSFMWESENYGTFQPVFIQAKTNKSTDRSGLGFDFSTIGGNLQWGRKINDNKAIGINFNVSNSNTDFSFGDTVISGTDSESYGVRLGGLIQPLDDRFLFGISLDYIYGPSRTTTLDVFGVGFGIAHSTDMTEQMIVRPGISFEYYTDSRIYLDYQYAYITANAGNLETHRFFVGAEQKVWKGFYVRGGTVVDTYENIAWTAGTGVYPSETLSIDFAYQNNMFPELETEFGDSETFTGSISLAF